MDRRRLLDVCEFIIAWVAKFALSPSLIFISLAGLFIGAILAIKPKLAIEIQIRFYALINWKIEPISLPKEIHNTRIMGWLLVILCCATLFFTINRTHFFP